METTIDEAGRVIIPKELQTKLGLKPGMKMDVKAAGRTMMLKPAAVTTTSAQPADDLIGGASAESGLVLKNGVLVFMCDFEDPSFNLPAFVEATRNARDYDLSSGAE